MLEMGRLNKREKISGCSSLGLDLAGIRAGQSPFLGYALQLPVEDIAGALWRRRAPRGECSSNDVSGVPPDHYVHLAKVKVELLASTLCVARCVK